jgi:DNA-binding transcriptional ArsR family regulator
MRTPNTPESYLRHPTSTLLATPGSVRVLRELLEVEVPLAVSTLAERTRLSGQAVRNTLAELRRGGIVEELGEGRGRLYRPDVNHPLYLPLASLFRAEAERFETIVEALAHALGNLTPEPLGAWIYGTVARGEDVPDTDLELALVSADEDVKTPVTRLREMLGPIQDVQRVWVSVVGLAPSDVRRLSEKDRWWKSATDPHIPVFGSSPTELAGELERPPLPRGVFRG